MDPSHLHRSGGLPPLQAVVITGSGMRPDVPSADMIPVVSPDKSNAGGGTTSMHVWHRGTARILTIQGRRHSYEGCTADAVTDVIALAAGRGARLLIATNAAGGISDCLRTGDMMIVDDIMPMPGVPVRFRTPSYRPERRLEVFDQAVNDELERRCLECGIQVRRGTYVSVPGPSYETRAEIRALASMGADAVGMSTLLEVIAARALGMKTIAVSLITNEARPNVPSTTSHDDVVHKAAEGNKRIWAVVDAALSIMLETQTTPT